MLQISVRQPYILRGLLLSDILINTLSKACKVLNDDIYRELAASTIYTLAFAFRMPVTIQIEIQFGFFILQSHMQ